MFSVSFTIRFLTKFNKKKLLDSLRHIRPVNLLGHRFKIHPLLSKSVPGDR